MHLDLVVGPAVHLAGVAATLLRLHPSPLAAPQGAKKYISEHDKDWSVNDSAWVSAVCAAGLALLSAAIGIPLMKRAASKVFTE